MARLLRRTDRFGNKDTLPFVNALMHGLYISDCTNIARIWFKQCSAFVKTLELYFVQQLVASSLFSFWVCSHIKRSRTSFWVCTTWCLHIFIDDDVQMLFLNDDNCYYRRREDVGNLRSGLVLEFPGTLEVLEVHKLTQQAWTKALCMLKANVVCSFCFERNFPGNINMLFFMFS